jgi:hypothetical protein
LVESINEKPEKSGAKNRKALTINDIVV